VNKKKRGEERGKKKIKCESDQLRGTLKSDDAVGTCDRGETSLAEGCKGCPEK